MEDESNPPQFETPPQQQRSLKCPGAPKRGLKSSASSSGESSTSSGGSSASSSFENTQRSLEF